MNTSTPDFYEVGKFMVECSGVEKSRIEIFCYLLDYKSLDISSSDFSTLTIQPFNPIRV
jgi:hypothetical protein